jgi:hypothetical protein
METMMMMVMMIMMLLQKIHLKCRSRRQCLTGFHLIMMIPHSTVNLTQTLDIDRQTLPSKVQHKVPLFTLSLRFSLSSPIFPSYYRPRTLHLPAVEFARVAMLNRAGYDQAALYAEKIDKEQ